MEMVMVAVMVGPMKMVMAAVVVAPVVAARLLAVHLERGKAES